jgi:Transposase DDE domain/Insertion element 4 transposase N-terminal
MIHLARDFEQMPEHLSSERLLALERIIPPETVQAVLEQTGHAHRYCPILPHLFVTYLVLGLGLFGKDSHTIVFKHFQRFRPGGTPGRNTIAEARRALGVAPMRLLADKVVRPLATKDVPGCFYRDLRMMAVDGFVLNLPDTPANERVFGRPQSGRAPGAFPQARVLALCEVGTHVICQHLIKPCHRGETSMAPWVLRGLTENMLLLWDRNFFSYKLLKLVKDKNAQLLARIKCNLIFKPIQELSDGSYLAKAYPSARHREKDKDGILVRIIEYTLGETKEGKPAEVHRLLTTLLDEKTDPATDLIVLYHERWEEELAIDEVKTHQMEKKTLRSKAPCGVVQEIEGLLLAHFVIRELMVAAAEMAGVAPRQMSFTNTLKILRLRLPEVPKNTKNKAGRQRWWKDLLAEVSEHTLEPRRHRVNPRVIKQKMSKWPKKRAHHRNPPQPSKPFRNSININ